MAIVSAHVVMSILGGEVAGYVDTVSIAERVFFPSLLSGHGHNLRLANRSYDSTDIT